MSDWSPIFGTLSSDAITFVRFARAPSLDTAVAALAAAMVVLGALGCAGLFTYKRAWGYLTREWWTSVDHKKIGIMYVMIAGVMMVRALLEAMLMRTQQAVAINAPGVVSPEHFGELFTTHGTIMIFFVAMPFLTGLMNFAVPLQIGARDVAFPVLNAIGLWLTGSGAALMMASLVIGQFSIGGWSGYPPFTEAQFSPGAGVDYWIWALTLSSIGSTMTGLNFAVTIYKLRAPGMQLFRMPLFCWTSLCTSILMIFAMPPLTVATLLLALDRYLGFHFFTNDAGGNVMNYANLFWLFGHPEVYILILPAFGIFSEVIPTFAAKKLYGYDALIWATMAIAVLSFTVWLHHFFTMGQSATINAAFGIATITIGVPTGVKVYNWIWTMFRGRIRFTPPMIYSCAFILTFVIGGLSGIILAVPPLDYMMHNTLFLVAHFHNMLIPGTLYGLLAGYTYWFPKAFGFRLDDRWGTIAAWCWVIGFYLAFMPLYVLGAQGMPRRMAGVYSPEFRPWLYVAWVGGLVLVSALASLIVQLWVSIRRREALRDVVGDPWNGRTLEWSIASPAPEYNFACIPQVEDRDEFSRRKQAGAPYPRPASYEDIEAPSNTFVGMIVGVIGFYAAFAVTWHIWWLAALTIAVVIGAVIAQSFRRDIHRTIPAAEIARDEARWYAVVDATQAVGRDAENRPANRGLAEASA